MKNSDYDSMLIEALRHPSLGLIEHTRKNLPSPFEIDIEDNESISDLLVKVSEHLLGSLEK